MALHFPFEPHQDQEFEGWRWDGYVWECLGGGGQTGPVTLFGDVNGLEHETEVVRLRGHNIADTAPVNGQALRWNGHAWAPGDFATRQDVDDLGTQITNYLADYYLPLTGGRLTGPLYTDDLEVEGLARFNMSALFRTTATFNGNLIANSQAILNGFVWMESGSVQIGGPIRANSRLRINATQEASIQGERGNNPRWQLVLGTNEPEVGNAGANFELFRNTGTADDFASIKVMRIERATGLVELLSGLALCSLPTVDPHQVDRVWRDGTTLRISVG